VFTDGAKPVSVGRTQRTVPERTRRVVLHRDRDRCRVPWCEHTRWLQVHHLDEWTRDDGPTDTWNLATCCGWCHRAVHRGEFSISGNADDPDGLVFRGPDGSVIRPGARPVRADEPPPMPARPYEHPLGERLDSASLFFTDPPGRSGPAAGTPPTGQRPPPTSQPPPGLRSRDAAPPGGQPPGPEPGRSPPGEPPTSDGLDAASA
jgi:hypothetical protein